MEVCRVFTFDAAHILPEYPGKCRNLHGHTYTLEVFVSGGIDDVTGMVMDYNYLKKVVDKILNSYDHAFLANGDSASSVEIGLRTVLWESNLKIKLIDGPTTTENIANTLLYELKLAGLFASKLRLSETPKTFVEVSA